MSTDGSDDKLYTEAVKLTAKSIFDAFEAVNSTVPRFRQTVLAYDVDVWDFKDTVYGKVYCTDMPTEYADDQKTFKAFVSTTYAGWASLVDTIAFPGALTDDLGRYTRYREYPFQTDFDNDVITELEKMFAEADIELNGSIGIEHDFEYGPASTDFVIYFEIDSETEETE